MNDASPASEAADTTLPSETPGARPEPGDEHGPNHLGCPTCDPWGGQPAPADRKRLATVSVTARGERFRIVQLQGQLIVCSPENGNCCCGRAEKGRMPFDNHLWSDEWEQRKIRNKLHLTFSGCLGPCAVGNSALLQLHGRSIWFKDLNDAALVPRVYDYAQAMLAAGKVLPPPEGLRDHVYERFIAPPDDGFLPLVAESEADGDGLDRLDPVCLMDVDPATARHRAEYQGRTYVFCAPSCKKLFLADPDAYLVAA